MTHSGKDPRAVKIAQTALQGLTDCFDLGADFDAYTKTSQASPLLRDLAASFDAAAKQIGVHIFEDTRIANQFALYNLTRSSPGLDRTWTDRKSRTLELIAKAINQMASDIADISECEGEHSDIDSALVKFFNRTSSSRNAKRNLGYTLLFHLGLARAHQCDFSADKVLNDMPAISGIFTRPLSVLQSDAPSCEEVVEKVRTAFTSSNRELNSSQYLGGLLEAGITDHRELWAPLFQKPEPSREELAAADSEERYYVTYRLSSSKQSVGLFKSFLVFQAPGRIRAKTSMRDHFAMKAFTRYDEGVARSAGAVVALGKQIVGFASRRLIEDVPYLLEDKPQHPDAFRGATMLTFHKNWFVKDSPVLVGMVMTTNREERSMASPILCLRTDKWHSETVGLDQDTGLKVLGPNEFPADACDNTWLTATDQAQPEKLSEWIWALLHGRPYELAEWDCVASDGTPPILAPNLRADDLLEKLELFGYGMRSEPTTK